MTHLVVWQWGHTGERYPCSTRRGDAGAYVSSWGTLKGTHTIPTPRWSPPCPWNAHFQQRGSCDKPWASMPLNFMVLIQNPLKSMEILQLTLMHLCQAVAEIYIVYSFSFANGLKYRLTSIRFVAQISLRQKCYWKICPLYCCFEALFHCVFPLLYLLQKKRTQRVILFSLSSLKLRVSPFCQFSMHFVKTVCCFSPLPSQYNNF